jgi:hypothetical protein
MFLNQTKITTINDTSFWVRPNSDGYVDLPGNREGVPTLAVCFERGDEFGSISIPLATAEARMSLESVQALLEKNSALIYDHTI